MFSSEQIFEVNGSMDQLETAIEFAIRMAGIPNKMAYQITEDGKYCIGWLPDEKKGWNPLPFYFDAHILAEIIKQHLYKQDIENPYEDWDGSSEKGFLMKSIDRTFANEQDGIKNPFYGIISIEPDYIYYAK